MPSTKWPPRMCRQRRQLDLSLCSSYLIPTQCTVHSRCKYLSPLLYIYMILPTSPSHFMFQNCTLVLNMHSLILQRLQYRIPWTLGKKFAVCSSSSNFFSHSLSFFSLPLRLFPLFITSYLFSLPLSPFHYILPFFITSCLFSLPLSSHAIPVLSISVASWAFAFVLDI